MGKMAEIISEIEERKQLERDRAYAMQKLDAEKARRPQLEDEERISVAAMSDYEGCVAELHGIGDAFAPLYQKASDLKTEYLAVVAEMGKLSREARSLSSEAENAKKHIRNGNELIVPQLTHDLDHAIIAEPSAFIGRRQVQAAFRGENWQIIAPYDSARDGR